MVRRIDLSRLQLQFIGLAKEYMARNKMSQHDMAVCVRLTDTEVSGLLSGKRKLTGSCLTRFVMGGVIMANQLQRGNVVDQREEEFWGIMDALISDAESLTLMKRITELGGDPKVALRNYLEIIKSVK